MYVGESTIRAYVGARICLRENWWSHVVWRTTVILIVTMYTEFVLYYTMLIVLNKFNSIQFNVHCEVFKFTRSA